jgi:hypothetical protein
MSTLFQGFISQTLTLIDLSFGSKSRPSGSSLSSELLIGLLSGDSCLGVTVAVGFRAREGSVTLTLL